MKKVVIRCDHCGTKWTNQNIIKWYLRVCPVCRIGIPILWKDIVIFFVAYSIHILTPIIVIMGALIGLKYKSINYILDTKGLRN